MGSDFADTIERFSEPLVVTRRAQGTTSAGIYTPAAGSSLNINGCIQDLTPRDLQQLEGGRGSRASKKLYTTEELRTEKDPDTITYKGISYMVVAINDWKTHGNYFKYALVKVEAATG